MKNDISIETIPKEFKYKWFLDYIKEFNESCTAKAEYSFQDKILVVELGINRYVVGCETIAIGYAFLKGVYAGIFKFSENGTPKRSKNESKNRRK